MRLDVVGAVAVGAARRQLVPAGGGLPVQAARVLGRLGTVAGPAFDGRDADVVPAVTIGAARRRLVPPRGGPSVKAARVLGRLGIVAEAAVDGLYVLLVGQLRINEVLVACDALDLGVCRGRVPRAVDVDRNLLTVANPGELRILVAHQAFVVLLGRDRDRDEQEPDGGCQYREVEPAE